MPGDLANQLKGSRSDVEEARRTVEAKFREISEGLRRGTNGDSDAVYALRYELSVLRHICYAVKENPQQNGDLYADIVGVMLPHVGPCEEKASLWEAHLTSLRYILHGMCQERSIGACQKLYALIRAQPCRLQEETDHKIYLDIHLTHFNGIYTLMQKQLLPLEASSQLCFALESLGELFEAMRVKRVTRTGPLVERLNETLFGKRSRTFFKSLSFLPAESMAKMFGPLMKLLASSSTLELSNQFSEYLSFTLALVQIDMLSPEASQLSLQLLRMSKDLFKQETNLTYALQLLYYYLKLLYVREATPNFKRTYVDLIRKFQNFFEHKAAPQATEQWLTDLLVAMQRLQTLLHQSGSKLQSPFQVFWQQMEGEGSPEAYAAHFQLLQSCAGLAVNVTRSPLGSSCSNEACKSVRRHCLMAYGLCALDAYINWQPTQEQKADRTPHKSLLGILSILMDVAKSMKCLGPSSLELIKLVRQLTHVADQVSCPEQISLLWQLLAPLQQLRPLIASQELRGLLRRLFKASCHCKDPQMAGRLCASYLASLTNPARLRSQICAYYHSQGKEEKEIQKCVYEWHESCPLPCDLSPVQKRQLYDTDLYAVLHYVRNPSVLHLKSLLRCRMSDYHLVLISRQLRSDGSVLRECQELISKLKTQSSLTRMEQLCLGHAHVGLLLDALEAQKFKVSSKETGENLLEELLLRQNLSEINIDREQRLVSLASEAITGFNHFFSRADEEPLKCEDTAIDWEALIDDAVAAAMALSTMGYQSQADEAWLLLLRISWVLMDRFTYLRSLTHFLSQNEVQARLKLNLEEEVERAEDLLDDLWPQLPSGRFFKRQDSTVMLCLCHLASYYARKECLSHAQLILLLVEQLRGELPERLGKSDIVLITLQTVRFRLSYQQRQPEGHPRMPVPLRQLDTLQDTVRSFSNLSSLDGGTLQLLLSTLVRESTECSANRLTERLAFSNIVLQLVLQSGLALRAIEVFLAWLWTNLQMENLDRAQSKLRLIEHCLGIKRLKPKEAAPLGKAKIEVKDTALSDLASNLQLLQLVEPIRKQQQQLDVGLPNMLSLRPQSPSSQTSLDRYLSLNEAPSALRENFQLQCTYFLMGCLHARLCFLQRNSEQLDDFYASADSKLREDPQLRASLGSMVQVQQLYRANYLRFRGQHLEAITVAQLELETLKEAEDIDYGYNFRTQLKTAELELRPESPEKVQGKGLRRALNFNLLSPERKNSAEKETPSEATSSRVKPSEKKALKFKIYTELELRPPSGSGASSSCGSSNENENTPPVNLDTCQSIELSSDDESPSSLVSLKPSLPQTIEKTKPKAKSRVNIAIACDDSPKEAPTPSQKVAPRSTRAARVRQPEETPKTAPLSTRRPRRAVPVAVPEPEQSTEPDSSVGTRSRRRK